MDDGKRENNKIKRPKSDHVKSVVSVYLHRRQFSSIKPRIIPKKTALNRAVLSSRISRPNSICNFINECDSLPIEYSFMFQKFMFWLKDQTNKKNRCYDIEKVVGPLFCHFYMDIRSSGKSHDAISSSSSFFKAHVDKVDKSKCDDTVKDILKVIGTSSENLVQNGSDGLNYDELKEQFRSSKIVTRLKPESLRLLKKFCVDSSHIESHIVLLQALQSWFDFQLISENDHCNNDDSKRNFKCAKYKFRDQPSMILDSKVHIKEEASRLWFDLKTNLENDCFKKIKEEDAKNFQQMHMKHEAQDYKDQKVDVIEQKDKIKNVIKKSRKLLASVCNIRILNNKSFVTCGLIRSHAGLAAFAEKNILRVLPLQVLVDSVCNVEQVDHIRFIHHSKQIYCVALCPKNEIICTGSADYSICVYSLSQVKLLKRLFGHFGPVYCVAISNNSKYVASGSHDGTARLWSLKSGRPLRVFTGHTDAITSVHFHPNSLYLATGSADRNARIWCLNSANTVRLLHAAKKEVYAVAFSPSGQHVACASDDKKVRIWDITTTKVVHEFKNRESSVIHLLWSKNCKQLCGGTVSGVVKIWEIKEKDKEQLKEHKHSDTVVRRRVNGQLLSLDCTLGTWACLSVPKDSPFDDL